MIDKLIKEVIVVGGGLAGLSAAMKLAENGCHVKLVCLTKARRSHSVCAQGGMNIAVNLKGEGDSPFVHAFDTIKGGDFLANQPPVLEMCMTGPGILKMLDRFGCPFNRTPEGRIDFRRFGGTLYNRTAFCGASTGQQFLYALDEQVRRYESLGTVEKFENHEFLRLVIDEQGRARGIVMQDLYTLKLITLKADAVVFGTGGLGFLYKKSTNSTFCTGASNGRLFTQGMHYANGEFIQIHPTAIPGNDKLRLITETCRGEGGRVWVYGDSSKEVTYPDGKIRSCGKTGEPWYFLEEMYPGYGNMVPRDIASRALLQVCQLGLGIDQKQQVYLDLSHLPEANKDRLRAALEIYEKFTGSDPRKVPMKIFPAVHYTMGGAWVDWPAADDPDRMERFRQMTNIPGCFNIGESDYAFHGANRLGGNSLLSCIYAGLVAGVEIPRYIESLDSSYHQSKESIFTSCLEKEKMIQKEIFNRTGSENLFGLYDELADWMVNYVTVTRKDKDLKNTLSKIDEIQDRLMHVTLPETQKTLNQSYVFAHQFPSMIELAKVITKGALLRNESRGSHAKVGHHDRDDENWLKTTIADYAPDEPTITYKAVDIRHFKPVKRDYLKAKKEIPEIKNVPDNIELPI